MCAFALYPLSRVSEVPDEDSKVIEQEVMEELRPFFRLHYAPGMVLGSLRTTLFDIFTVLMHAFALEYGDTCVHLNEYCASIRVGTSDLGT